MERDADKTAKTEFVNISTHTLTWSVTCRYVAWFCYGLHFNSHAHVERDVDPVVCTNRIERHFNSHAHVERDPFTETRLYQFFISTHTLTWSVT